MGFDVETIAYLIVLLALAGVVIGFLAGFFGIGGGAISVPIFFEVFQYQGYDAAVSMPLAVGTSLAVIVPTMTSSAWAHHKKGAVDFRILRAISFPIVLGVLIGVVIAGGAEPYVFQLVFMVVASFMAFRMLRGTKRQEMEDVRLTQPGVSVAGGIIGLLSTIMGIGGGGLSNIYMTYFGVPIHRAIATSAGIGVLVAIPATAGYALVGLGVTGLPPLSIGYVSVAAFLLTIPTSTYSARFGVAAAHHLTKRALERCFGTFLICVSARFAFLLIEGGMA